MMQQHNIITINEIPNNKPKQLTSITSKNIHAIVDNPHLKNFHINELSYYFDLKK